MLGKPSRRTRRHLNEKGRVAQAEVLEIADTGPTIEREGADRKWWRPDDSIPDWMRPSRQVYEMALKTRLRVRPEGEAEFDVETTIRFPESYEPKVGDEIEVIYDPDDHDKLMLGRYDPHAPTLDEGTKKTAQDWMNAYGQGGEAASLGASEPGGPIEGARAAGSIGGPGMTTGASYPEGVDPNARMLELATMLQKGEITMKQFEEEQKRLFGR